MVLGVTQDSEDFQYAIECWLSLLRAAAAADTVRVWHLEARSEDRERGAVSRSLFRQ